MAKLLSGTRIYGTATVDTFLYVSGTATATSTITGAVVVTGGVGIGGALYAGSIYSNGTLIGSSVSTTTTDTFFINNATASTSAITGALRVLGGAGIGGDLWVGGTTNSTNITAGNAGYGNVYLTQYSSVFAQGNISAANVLLQASANNLAYGIGVFAATGGINSLYSSGAIYFTTGRTVRDRDIPTGGSTFMSLSTSGVLTLSGTVASTSTTTGALTVAGGVGIGGQVNIFNTLTVGPISAITLPNTVAQFTSNVNSYGQIHVQNTSAGAAASTDFILTKDTGNDTTGFLDLGINNSGFSQAGVFDVVGAGSGYLYVNGGDLALGTDGAYTVRIFAGGSLTANEQVRINTTGMGIKTTSPGSALDVKGTLRLSGATSGYVGLSPASVAGSTTYTLPAADGTAGQVLQTSGGAILSWTTPAGGVSGALLVTLQQQFGGF